MHAGLGQAGSAITYNSLHSLVEYPKVVRRLGGRSRDYPLVHRWKPRLREAKGLPKVMQQLAESELGPGSVTAKLRFLVAPHTILGTKETLGPSLQHVIGFGWVGSN